MNIKNKRIILSIIFCITAMVVLNVMRIDSYAAAISTGEGYTTALENFFKEYKAIIVVCIAISLITNIGIFIYHLVALGANSTNPQKRARTIHNLIVSGISTALLGAVTLIYSILFWTFKTI